MTKTFYSNGKILLTGEYAVMFGAKSLAFPLVYGQEMIVEDIDDKILFWDAFSEEGPWFKARYLLPDLIIDETNDTNKAIFLQKILRKLFLLNDKLKGSGYYIRTKVNFKVNWGFGTSSTLINNLALWAGTDPFKFYYSISKGSGYDIACASGHSPIVFQRNGSIPQIRRVKFQKKYTGNIFLVYSGKKKATEKHIQQFLRRPNDFQEVIRKVSELTGQIVRSEDVDEFIRLISYHEEIIGRFIQKKPVQYVLFPGFKGAIKSLGAWGGDFYLAVSTYGENYVHNYFEQLGHSLILPFNKTVIM